MSLRLALGVMTLAAALFTAARAQDVASQVPPNAEIARLVDGAVATIRPDGDPPGRIIAVSTKDDAYFKGDGPADIKRGAPYFAQGFMASQIAGGRDEVQEGGIGCDAGRWSPGIGDPTVMGWATVALYFLAAFVCWRARIAAGSGRERLFWIGLAGVLVAFGINKELDLQSLFTVIGRCAATAEGWYARRHGVQEGFLLGLAIFGAVAIAAAAAYFRRDLRRIWLALTGATILILFVLARASSFHHLDVFINTRVLGLHMNWAMELGALVLIATAAWRARRNKA